MFPSTVTQEARIKAAQSHAFYARDWKALERNTLRGFVTIELPSGLVIKECSLHERDGRRWVGLPGKPYTAKDGQTSYVNIIDFGTKQARTQFQELALKAIDELLGEDAK
jgi:hypothetical protein